jgi:MAF protein
MILASSSPRRRELLSSLGVIFSIYKPDINENQRHAETPLNYVQRLASEKAYAGGVGRLLGGDLPDLNDIGDIVLAADTIVIAPNGQTILGKPVDAEEAAATLRLLRGQAHTVCTAIHLEWFSRRMSGNVQMEDAHEIVQTRVTMRDYSDDEIAAYIATGDPFDKAGGYAIQHAGFHPVAHIHGCYNNVVGLPLCAVKRCLELLGAASDLAPAPDECDCGTPYTLG